MKRSNRNLMAALVLVCFAALAFAVDSNALFRVTIAEANLSVETFREGEVSTELMTLTNATRTLDTIRLLNGLVLANPTQGVAIASATASLTYSNLTDSLYLMVNGRTYVYPNVTNVLTVLNSLSGVTITNMGNITNVTKTGG